MTDTPPKPERRDQRTRSRRKVMSIENHRGPAKGSPHRLVQLAVRWVVRPLVLLKVERLNHKSATLRNTAQSIPISVYSMPRICMLNNRAIDCERDSKALVNWLNR